MIPHDVEQGSDAWKLLRAGIPTASCFDKILTAGGKESAQVEAYENQLVAERLIGKPVEVFEGNAHTERGNELEPDAANFYAMTTGRELQKVGFITTDDKLAGASLDRLIGTDGALEIKCPAPHTHVAYMIGKRIDDKYKPQLQGQLWVSERQWVDIISYHPEMKPVIIRVERHEAYIAMLSRLVERTAYSVLNKYEQLRG